MNAEKLKTMFFLGSLDDKYVHIVDELHNDFIKGDDKFPANISHAVDMIKGRFDKYNRTGGSTRRQATMFAQHADDEHDEQVSSGSHGDDEDLTLEDIYGDLSLNPFQSS